MMNDIGSTLRVACLTCLHCIWDSTESHREVNHTLPTKLWPRKHRNWLAHGNAANTRLRIQRLHNPHPSKDSNTRMVQSAFITAKVILEGAHASYIWYSMWHQTRERTSVSCNAFTLIRFTASSVEGLTESGQTAAVRCDGFSMPHDQADFTHTLLALYRSVFVCAQTRFYALDIFCFVINEIYKDMDFSLLVTRLKNFFKDYQRQMMQGHRPYISSGMTPRHVCSTIAAGASSLGPVWSNAYRPLFILIKITISKDHDCSAMVETLLLHHPYKHFSAVAFVLPTTKVISIPGSRYDTTSFLHLLLTVLAKLKTRPYFFTNCLVQLIHYTAFDKP